MTSGLPRGARLGVDVGTVRVGVAASDPDGLIATPVETVPRAVPASGPTSGADRSSAPAAVPADLPAGLPDDRPGLPADLARLAEIADERAAAAVYVGLPRHLSGQEGSSSRAARTYAEELARVIAPVPVRLVDERMSTVTAHQALYASGRAGRRHRQVVDQAAAVVILQTALDAERATGQRAGEPVGPPATARGGQDDGEGVDR